MPTAPRLVNFKCVVTCDLTPTLKLNGEEITLTQSGKDWTGIQAVKVTDLVDIHCRVRGVVDEDWSISITTVCANGAKPNTIFAPPSGKIPSGGSFEFYAAGAVPAAPCNAAPKP